MRVIEFLDTLPFAGTEAHVLDLASSLRQQGQEPIVACPANSALAAKAAAAGIPVLPVAAEAFPGLKTVKTLAAELRSGRVDIIHAHNGRTHLLAVAAVRRAGRGKVVATQHFLSPHRTGRRGPKAWLAARMHHWAQHHTAAFIAISHAVRDGMLARADAPAEKITVVHNGIIEPQKAAPESIAALRRELGVGRNPMILCAARLQKEKDIPTLIKAAAALRFDNAGGLATADPQPGLAGQPAGRGSAEQRGSAGVPQLLIAGEGDQRPEIESLIAALFPHDQAGNQTNTASPAAQAGPPAGGIAAAAVVTAAPAAPPDHLTSNSANSQPASTMMAAPHVRLLGFRRDVAALMAASDIFVLPAPAEPFGLVVVEAMAMAKPVIAAAAGGPREIVTHGATGLLVPPQNPSALAAAIMDLLRHPEKARAMGLAGRRRYEEQFNAQRMARQTADVYSAIMRGT